MTQPGRKFTTRRLVCLVLCFAFLLAACSKPSPPPEPKGLTIFYSNVADRPTEFAFLKEALENKFPEYAFHYVDIANLFAGTPGDRYSYRKFEESGSIPDLIIEPIHVSSSRLFMQEYTSNMEAALRGSSIDLNTFESEYLDHLRALSDDGTLHALPLSANRYALHYSVDEFPDELSGDMRTWPQIVELAKQISMNVDMRNLWAPVSNQYGLEYINAQDELALNRDRWEEVLGQFRTISLSLTDTSPSLWISPLGTGNQFYYPDTYNWDLLPFPQIDEENDIGPHRLQRIAAIGPATRKLEDAMNVLTYLTSYEYQLAQAKAGIASVLDRPEVQDQFGANSSFYAGKNVAAFFQTSPSEPPQQISKYDRLVWDPPADPSVSMIESLLPTLQQMIDEPLEPAAAFGMIGQRLTSFLDFVKRKPVDSY